MGEPPASWNGLDPVASLFGGFGPKCTSTELSGLTSCLPLLQPPALNLSVLIMERVIASSTGGPELFQWIIRRNAQRI
jgi:hypothetical protein